VSADDVTLKEIIPGAVFNRVYPFYDSAELFGGMCSQPGCHMEKEQEDMYCNIWFTANAEGEIIYEVVAIAEMPGRYTDRVFFKKNYLYPGGDKYNEPRLEVATTSKLLSLLNRVSPFPQDYEVEEDKKPLASIGGGVF